MNYININHLVQLYNVLIVYSIVVSLQGLRIVLFLAKLYELDIWVTDIRNAYLEAKTSKKVYIIVGPFFGENQGSVLRIHKVLYGLQSSGKQCHTKYPDDLRDMDFFFCKAELDIWMRKSGNLLEYVVVYVNALNFVVRDRVRFGKELENNYKYKFKSIRIISFNV